MAGAAFVDHDGEVDQDLVALAGVDLNPRSEAAARAHPDSGDIAWVTGDYAAQAGPWDFVISSLVAHHMTRTELIAFLRFMEARAERGWFVNDLHRHAMAYHGFRALSAVMRWHRFVRHDGPLSVARAFRRADWERLIARAGLDRRTIELRWHLPFRLCVGRQR